MLKFLSEREADNRETQRQEAVRSVLAQLTRLMGESGQRAGPSPFDLAKSLRIGPPLSSRSETIWLAG